ncbi:efflux RND transporter periplasmic adaptor subunit [Janthinobacterium agaricidamnosum]|uniref:Efflux transporter, RND family, MFP subunit n=1 Tax=Janthinobacterium agaricidamnosum NBRC 102515 = DSM 9628 TaxID=1349767 RepID=W0VF75_9BURK|nr:efflux RND transporter periplasmic adaptor subunit [Janthinobacterium agaricidamnosum]CDG85997.1 efflux transporter, RND family, MFP subunit [Janthinobacterium agaricidamnosum NBRC 102515 = DSM 9628]
MKKPSIGWLRNPWLMIAVLLLAMLAVAIGKRLQAAAPLIAPAAAPMKVGAATVALRDARIWDAFSGRLEAVERVELRSRVAGAIAAIHFNEGKWVRQGELLVSIDPAPYAAEVARLKAQAGAAESNASHAHTELERSRLLWSSQAIARRDVDESERAAREADASLAAARAALQRASLDLEHASIRAPVAGRVGRREVTPGNLVDAGPDSPVLTTLVSVDPVYASFDAGEQVVQRALAGIGPQGNVAAVPVQMEIDNGSGLQTRQGHLQLVDNQVDARSGTIRVRAVFPNPDGALMPGQFVRLRLGQASSASVLLIDERAIGTDQDRRYVMVLDAQNKASHRDITLGGMADGMRIVRSGLVAGERVVVDGFERVKPGAIVSPVAAVSATVAAR